PEQLPGAKETTGPGAVVVVLLPDEPGGRVGAVGGDHRGPGAVAEGERAVVHIGQRRLAAALDPGLELAHVVVFADIDHVVVGTGRVAGGERRGVGEKRWMAVLPGDRADAGEGAAVGAATAAQVVPVQQVDHTALARLHQDIRVGAGAER